MDGDGRIAGQRGLTLHEPPLTFPMAFTSGGVSPLRRLGAK
jgi:hypothetical protein